MVLTTNPELVFGQTLRTFTLKELQDLRILLKCNRGEISTAVQIFLESFPLSERDPLFWVRFAEQIKDDDNYPEKQFG